jgi:hypothetical protein
MRLSNWWIPREANDPRPAMTIAARRNKRCLAADAIAVLIEDCSTDGSSDESALPLGEA